MAGLVAASILIGIGMLWVVGKTSNQRAIERAKKRMQAHLLEMRLYADEPTLLFRAQGNLLLDNARYVGHMLRPAAFLALPMVVLFAHFDALYGRRPLRVGESTLVAVETTLDGEDLALSATGPLAVDSVSVTAPSAGQVAWRVRAVADGFGEVVLETSQGSFAKAAVVGGEIAYLSSSRTRSWWQRLLLAPGEARLGSSSEVVSIAIDYPPREVGFGGWETHWVIWFLVISILAAFLLRGYFGIVL